MKIELVLNENKFEYDLYHLIQAFYPEAEITIRYCVSDEDAERPGRDSVSDEDAEGPGRDCVSGEHAELPEAAVPSDGQVPSGEADLMFVVGYGEQTVSLRVAGRDDSAETTEELVLKNPADRAETKNQLKRLVYSSLVQRCGHTLSWGDLSGIRPVKLVTAMLDSGMALDDALHEMQARYCVSDEKANLALQVACREQTLLSAFDYRSGYSLYIDIPFCPSICLYCTFGSHPIRQWETAVEPYLEALGRELEYLSGRMKGVRLDTIYIGGGTPTSILPEQMDALLNRIEKLFPVHSAREFTVEAGRPDTVSLEMLQVLRAHSVTRISVNPQTMNQKTLDLIGRRHTVGETVKAFQMARTLGFEHINMDMIVGLPGEGRTEVTYTLRQIEALDPDDFTVHSLALKRAARLNLFRDTWRPVSFENSAAIMGEIAEGAARMKMQPYYLYRQKNMAGNFENVGYAKEGRACLYNILIMEEKQTIAGAGCGAATKLVLPDGSKAGRTENVKSLREYLDRTQEMIERKEQLFCKGESL